jgi:hypothetical protein
MVLPSSAGQNSALIRSLGPYLFSEINEARRSKRWHMTAKDIGYAKSVCPKGDFVGGLRVKTTQ